MTRKTSQHPLLNTPITLPNGAVIKNRFVKTSTNEAMGTRDMQPKPAIATLYKRWAQGGAGLILTGNVMVDLHALAEPGNIVVDEHSDIKRLQAWAQAGNAYDATCIMQLNHPGKQAPKTVSKQPVSPSAIPMQGDVASFFNPPRELTTAEIHQIVHRFTTAARIAAQTGFIGVQLHAAHGYLLNQFLSPHDNKRTDQYGGTIDNRMRIIEEIYTSIRATCPASFIVGIKLNSTDFTPDGFSETDSLYVAQRLAKLGIDFIEVSGGNYERPTMSQATTSHNDRVFFADYSAKLKTLIDTPVIVTGGIRTVHSMQEILEHHTADMIGLARPMAINPDIPRLVLEGQYHTVDTPHVTTHIRALDKKVSSMLGLVYYQLLMQQWAAGKTPRITQNAWPALLHALTTHGMAGLRPQRASK